jgi:putative FmdB family regulatory protein
MPTYTYKCESCSKAFDIQQSIKDEALTVCPDCKGKLQKVFGKVGITFKGSGFYRTDSNPPKTD